MQVLTATHYFGTHGGGIERVAERLNAELVRLGHGVVWLASDASPPSNGQFATRSIRSRHWVERKLGVPFPVPLPGELGAIADAVGKCDALVLHDCLYLSNIAAFLIARRKRKPVVIIQHIGDVPYRNPLLRLLMKAANRLITRPLLAAADQVVFISELTRRHFHGVAYREAPILAFNGVDASVFGPRNNDGGVDSLRAQLAVEKQGKLAVFVGRFVEKKGLHVIRRLAEQRPNVTFALAGKGPIDPLEWQLSNVKVLGQLSGDRLADLYRAGDLLILPSTGEGFPLVIQEALACGLPVLCGADTALADSEAAPYLIGAAVDPANPDRTAANFLSKLDRALACGPSSEGSAERAKFALERYSWTEVAQTYDRLLSRLAARSDSQHHGSVPIEAGEQLGRPA
jgi:glycosyltransferase involved in cell wall biosynthesis